MGDIDLIGSRMRQEDIREVQDLSGLNPIEAVRAAVKASWGSYRPIRGFLPGKVYIAYVDERPEVVFGVTGSDSIGVGHPWLLGSNVISRLPIRFVRESMRYVKEFLQDYPILTNIVDARNEVHIRWLEFMGFKFIADYPEIGPGRILAKQFILVRE